MAAAPGMPGGPGTEPRVGQLVRTADSVVLGTVKEVRGDRFKIDAPGEPDYWLPTSAIAGTDTVVSANEIDLILRVSQRGLDDIKVEGPD